MRVELTVDAFGKLRGCFSIVDFVFRYLYLYLIYFYSDDKIGRTLINALYVVEFNSRRLFSISGGSWAARELPCHSVT